MSFKLRFELIDSDLTLYERFVMDPDNLSTKHNNEDKQKRIS